METVTQEKMKVLQEIAQINVLISQGKAELNALEDGKQEFFSKRDKELLDRIKQLLSESSDILDKTKSNYKEVHEFYVLMQSFSEFLHESHKNFSSMVNDFNRNHELYKKDIDHQYEELSRLRKEINLDIISLEKDKKFAIIKRKELEEEARLIADRRGALERAWKELELKKQK